MFDESKSEIDAGADTGRRPDFTVDDPAGGGDPVDVWAERDGFVPRRLVGGGIAAVEDACFGGEHGAGADGDEVLDRVESFGDEVDRCVEEGGARAESAGNDEHVEVRRGFECMCGDYFLEEGRVFGVHAWSDGFGGDGFHGFGDEGEIHLMIARGGLEGGERPEDVERFKGLVEDDTVVEGFHGFFG